VGEAWIMKLRYTIRSLSEIDRIIEYVEQSSPQGAVFIKLRLQSVINMILEYPNIGQQTTRPNIRRVIASPYPYVVFYSVVKNSILTHTVRHTARKQ
jgi:toxin ParE1/3/4